LKKSISFARKRDKKKIKSRKNKKFESVTEGGGPEVVPKAVPKVRVSRGVGE